MLERQGELAQHLQEIQFVFAPAVLISCSSLLLLGFQNKFASLANRFRALNEEKRRLVHAYQKSEIEAKRLQSLTEQVRQLHARTRHVKNAILLQYAAIACFILASLFLFMNVYMPLSAVGAGLPIGQGPAVGGGPSLLAVVSFVTGLCLILVSSIIMMREVALAYRIVDLEGKS